MNHQYLATIPIIASSGSASARGNAAEFTITLTAPIVFDHKEKWAMTFVNASFPKPTNLGNSIYIYCDQLSSSELSGELYPLLKRLPPTRTTDDPQFEEETATVVVPRHIGTNVLTELTFRVAESTGVPVPSGSGNFTTIEVLLSRVE